MKNFLIFIAIIAIFLFPTRADAAQIVAAPSATLVSQIPVNSNAYDMRVKALKNVLERHNSPLADQAANFVKYADEYGIDWKLLPAISGLESSFGIHLMAGSYNAYGWGGGRIYFESWEDGIRVISKALKERYGVGEEANPWSIGPTYAESTTWAVRVNIFMNEINEEYLKLSTFSVIPSI